MSTRLYYGLNRTICDVFEAMKEAHKSHNYSYLTSLIDEAQLMGNRMESALYDIKDYEAMKEDKKKLQRELRKLEAKLESSK